MVEFNPDGSIKLPGRMQEQENKNKWKMKNTTCIEIKKDVVNHSAPKKCLLHFTFSDKITSAKFVSVILNQFKEYSQTPMTLIVDESLDIEIGTNFKRCSECRALIGRFREHMNGNLILKQGNCTVDSKRNMNYDDYFD